MPYSPRDLRPGDVLLMTSSSHESLPARLLDVLIAMSEANPFVHACLVGQGHLIDPLWRVQRASLRRYAANGWAFRVRATDADRLAAVGWAEQHVGNRYGVEEILADAARLDLHVVLPAWYRWRTGHWTCSGFVDQAYLQAGVRLTGAPLPSPADLAFSPLLIGPRPWAVVRHARRKESD